MIWNPFRKLQKIEEKRSIPTVKFDPKRVTPDVQEVIADRILNSKIIPDEHKPQATVVAIEATQRGRDLHHLCSFLIGLHIDKSDAQALSLSVINAAMVKIDVNRQIDLGLTKAKWRYSGVPCGRNKPGTKRLASSHLNADGKVYDIRKGLKIGTRYVYPGEDEGCMCHSQVIIPGFDD